MGINIEAMTAADWAEVRAIYLEGIAAGQSTFEVEAPAWEQWDAAHHPFARLVARSGGRVIGWAALSPVSRRRCYSGVAEVSVYVGAEFRGRGVGRLLLLSAIAESERQGIWTLQGATFPKNEASLRLQRACGFREIGSREQIGQLRGVWRDTILTERRSTLVGAVAGSAIFAESSRPAVAWSLRLGPAEQLILKSLDALLQSEAVRDAIRPIVELVRRKLAEDRAAAMAWEPIPLSLYGESLPALIRSSWVFILRAGATTGAERHPNSHQRMMSFHGTGDLQTGGEGQWQSNLLLSNREAGLEQRWVSIPTNVWHQAVVPTEDWVVVSFHTVPAEELIEERPDTADTTRTHQRRYTLPSE